jgi:ribosomal protein L11 methylase PrmA
LLACALLSGVITTADLVPFATGPTVVGTLPATSMSLSAARQTVAQPARKPDVFYAPTPQAVVDAMLKLARVTSKDVIYDLGSGDGRIPITAARVYGASGVGIDLDPALIREAQDNAQKAGVAGKVRFQTADLFKSDISPATVVTLYLTPFLNFQLLPKLNRELKPGTRVVSHQWEMMDPKDKYEYKPDNKVIVGNSLIYVWTIPIVRR